MRTTTTKPPPVSESRAPRPADWLPVHAALERILAALSPLPAERVRLADALGRTLAEPVASPIDQPPWDNSAMDGFAVRAVDVRGARPERPVVLRVIDDVPAGSFPMGRIGPGEAAKIMTGAPVPDGADCVIRVEHTSAWGDVPPDAGGRDDTVSVFRDDDAGRSIRPRGEDVRRGAVVLEAGRVLRSGEVGVLAMVGCAEVCVHRRPRVAIFSNGNELAALDEFDDVRAGRKIVNSNSYALAAAIQATGGVPVLLGIARDDEESIRAHVEAACDAGADVLMTTGGASVGEHDLMKDVLEDMGFRLDFWRVKMKPGSPVSFGWLDPEDTHGETAPVSGATDDPAPVDAPRERWPNGRLPVFGLPGNPVSALVAFEVLARPALRRLQGRRAVYTPTVQVRTAERMPSKPGLTQFLRVTLRAGDDDFPLARRTGPQGSGILTSMASADALLIVPEESAGFDAGALATAIPLRSPDEAQESARR